MMEKPNKKGYVDLNSLVNENKWTMVLTTLLVAGVALGTGSLHCLWGLVMLLNLNVWRLIKIVRKEDVE